MIWTKEGGIMRIYYRMKKESFLFFYRMGIKNHTFIKQYEAIDLCRNLTHTFLLSIILAYYKKFNHAFKMMGRRKKMASFYTLL
jgi:hypothetical protein